MTFSEYLETQGPSLDILITIPAKEREVMARLAFHWYLAGQTNQPIEDREQAFVDGWDLATEVMVYQYMAQSARELAEKETSNA